MYRFLKRKAHVPVRWFKDKKTRPYAIGGVIVLGILILRIVGAVGGAPATQDVQVKTVSLIDVAQTVAGEDVIKASGEIEAAGQVELRSEVSASVSGVYTTLGASVRQGQTLVVFRNGDVRSQLADAAARVDAAEAILEQYEAQLRQQQNRLAELQRGPRPEERNVAETSLRNAQQTLEAAKESYAASLRKTEEDYKSTLQSVAAGLLKSTQTAKEVLYTVSDIQYTYFPGNSLDGQRIADAKRTAIETIFDQPNAGRWTVESVSGLNGGVRTALEAELAAPQETALRQLGATLLTGFSQLAMMYDAVPLRGEMSAADISALTTKKQQVQTEIATITSLMNSIDGQLTTNETVLSSAKSARTTAQNAVEQAQEQLGLVLAGAAPEQIAAQEAAVAQAEASVRAQRAQLQSARASVGLSSAQVAKTVVRAPISGKIATLPAKVGELMSPGSLVASIVNTDALQVKAFIDGTQLASIAIGAPVTINGSASGTVSFISPALDPETRKVEVAIVVTNVDVARPLVVGQYADVEIARSDASASYLQAILPLDAVQISTEGAQVFSVVDGKVQGHPVVLGRIRGTAVEVLSGLEAVERVVAEVRGLSEGSDVTIR